MKRFSALKAIVFSFFSRDLYRDVARQWRGAGLLYLLLVAVLATLPLLIGIQISLSRFMAREAGVVLKQIPAIVIRSGRVSSDVPMPCVIRSREGRALAIIDTTGQVTSLDSTEARLLLTSNRVAFKKSAFESRVFEFSSVRHFEVDGQKVARWLHVFLRWFTPALAPFVFIGAYLYRLAQVLVFAALAIPLAAGLKARLGFAALMRVTAVAFTPMLAIDALHGASHAEIPMWWLWSSMIAFFYLWVALRANREPEAPAALAPVTPAVG